MHVTYILLVFKKTTENVSSTYVSSTLDFDFYHLDSLRRDFLLFFAFGFVAGRNNNAGWHSAPDCTGVVNTLPSNKAKCVERGV